MARAALAGLPTASSGLSATPRLTRHARLVLTRDHQLAQNLEIPPHDAQAHVSAIPTERVIPAPLQAVARLQRPDR